MKITIGIFILIFTLVLSVAYLISQDPVRSQLYQNDFRAQYVAAFMSSRGVRRDMYNLETQLYWEHEMYPKITNLQQLMPYIRTPLNAFLATPLAYLSYKDAYRISILLNSLLFVWLYYLTHKSLVSKGHEQAVIGTMQLLPLYLPFWIALLQNQFSFVIYLSLYWMWYFDSRERDYASGFSTFALLIAPHIWALVFVAMLIRHKFKIAASMVGAALANIILACIIYGPRIWLSYIDLLHYLSNQGDAYAIHPSHEATLRGAFLTLAHTEHMNIYTSLAWVISVIILIVTLGHHSQRSLRGVDLWYAGLVIYTILASPHLNLHDYSLMFFALILVAHHVIHNHTQYPLLYGMLCKKSYLYVLVAFGIVAMGVIVSMYPILATFICCCVYVGLYKARQRIDTLL